MGIERNSIVDYIEDKADDHEQRGEDPKAGSYHRCTASVLRALASDIRGKFDRPEGTPVQRKVTHAEEFRGSTVRMMIRCTLECGHVVERKQPANGRAVQRCWCSECGVPRLDANPAEAT